MKEVKHLTVRTDEIILKQFQLKDYCIVIDREYYVFNTSIIQ